MRDALVILTPAFAAHEGETWLPAQSLFIRTLNRLHPELDVVILSFRIPVAPGRRYTWHGNTVIAFGNGGTGKLNSLRLWTRVWQELRQLLRRHRIIGLFSFFCGECALVGHRFAAWHGLTHRIWVLGQDARAANNQVARIRPRAEELVAISDFLVREFQRAHGIRPAHLIPIGIQPEAFSAPAPARSIDLLGVGSLSAIKQYDVFVKVVAAVAENRPAVQAALCGGGTEHTALQRLIAEQHLETTLRLLGERSHAEALALMQQSRILLHPSAYEGFGLVCTEALCAGAHVISFCKPMDAPIAHWHIVDSPDAMVAKALELLRDPHTEFSRVLPFRMEDTVAQVLALYGYGAALG